MGFLTKFRQTMRQVFNKKKKTIDPQIEQKLKQFEQFNKLIDHYKAATDLFIGNVYGMAQKHKRISKLLNQIYSGSMYHGTAKRFSHAFQTSGQTGQKSLLLMKRLSEMILGLKKQVIKIKAQKRKRQDARLLYDHYRVKIQKIAHLQVHSDPKKKAKFTRNVQKTTNATKNYDEQTKQLNKILDEFMSKRNQFLGEIIRKFTQDLQAGFYIENHMIMKDLDDMEQSLGRCEDYQEQKSSPSNKKQLQQKPQDKKEQRRESQHIDRFGGGGGNQFFDNFENQFANN